MKLWPYVFICVGALFIAAGLLCLLYAGGCARVAGPTFFIPWGIFILVVSWIGKEKEDW